jgi:tRNA-uridine 2-sulfurtransferase
MNKKTVLVGMSGGVDSSVAALTLQQQGFVVVGAFMKNWEEDDDPMNNYCSATQDLNDAQQVCELLQIPLLKVNFAAEYWDKVFTIFLNEYKLGRTPNPDVLCNKEIKFKLFLEYAKQIKADFVATGHYARISQGATMSKILDASSDAQVELLTAIDPYKDQSYFLHALSHKQLTNCLFPVGHLLKTDVRKIAKKFGLINHNKKDSTGICFIGERKFKNFLEKYLPNQPGLILSEHGDLLGKHDGLMYYTIGQRKGLNIGGNSKYKDQDGAWYVADKDLINNELIVVKGENHHKLFVKKLLSTNVHWINVDPLKNQQPFVCYAKIRHRQTMQSCVVEKHDVDRLLVTFDNAQRAVTPGQYVVFYQQDKCLGGGIIEQPISNA